MKSERKGRKIDRKTVKAVAALLLAAGGCRHTQPTPREQALRTAQQVQRDYQANRARLKGEDNAEHQFRIGRADFSGLYGLFVEFPKRLLRLASNDTPLKAAAAMENASDADERRRGILKLASYPFGRRDPYTNRYGQIADNDADPIVRAAAVRAMDRSRYKPGVPIYVRDLENEDAGIRLEAAKALANIPDDSAVAPLIAHLNNGSENKDIRIACADALRNFRTVEAARALVGVLNDKDFGVAWQARKSLNLLTSRDFRYDESAWLSFLNNNDRPFG